MDTVETVGIDLGTTKSVIAVWSPAKDAAIVLPNREGKNITPSVVTFDRQTGELIVGQAARERMLAAPEDVVYSVKRFIGRTFGDKWVHYDQRNMTYDIEEAKQQKVLIRVGERLLTPPQISAEVLRKVKNDAEFALGGRSITRAVITVPAYFHDGQRWATKEAGELAGLSVPRIINEPTASALAFGLGVEPTSVAVYDLGGGTFDISILRIEHGLFRVKGIGGDTHLGGDDFDMAVVDWLKQQFEARHPGIELPVEQDPALRALLREKAREAKVALSSAPEVQINLPNLLPHEKGPLDLEVSLTREQFESLIDHLLERSLKEVDSALVRAGFGAEQIDEVLLVGGQTRTPAIKQALIRRYGWRINDTIPPEEAVARGAAILGARLDGHLKDRVRLWDVLPLSLGVELADGRMERIIKGNEEIPISRKYRRPFTTQRDGQTRIHFRIYQGERPIARDNTLIGDIELKLAPPRPRGQPNIYCTFTVDHDGILRVRAEDPDLDGQVVHQTFDHVYAMTPQQIDDKLKEAAEHREEDALTARLLQLRDELAEVRRTATNEEQLSLLQDTETALDARDADRAHALLAEIRSTL